VGISIANLIKKRKKKQKQKQKPLFSPQVVP
jgi:hypothetical protein